ncbi:nucleotidyltransferase family protein [Lentibacillus salicampi]|uniref:Nucleotidyltransferase domain-containing protein n=1 Tax=Lentibacillus salicampi TaxID=175306 RepID=A0A4Y9A974_9BACI|nr:nucleotidyltransferase domain-containing protein [Lentibacillus salicampi]TFJ91822.1 nucleotidyltransferase domain-containing protein [Lentibacillus salicampi]
MYDIEKPVYENLIDYFRQHTGIIQVILFGSRAKNTASFNSDIDLCIAAGESSKADIKESIDALIGVYSCDIVFADELNRALSNQIERDGIVIYKAES